jgi:SAM-dependent methyltransferase
MIKRGGILFDEKHNDFNVDWMSTHSYIASTLQLQAILEAKKYARGRLIDVGCGVKPFLHVFRKKVREHIGIDVPSTRHWNVEIDAVASGDHLPFKNRAFDTILSTSVLEHVQHPGKMFSEMHRVLRNNGYLILTTPCQYGLHEQPYDFFRYTKYGLRMLAEQSGFKVVYIKPKGGMLAIVAQLIMKYVAVSLYMVRARASGEALNAMEGFKDVKRNVVIQFVSVMPQKLFMLLYNACLRKLDALSSEVDPFIYIMVARK